MIQRPCLRFKEPFQNEMLPVRDLAHDAMKHNPAMEPLLRYDWAQSVCRASSGELLLSSPTANTQYEPAGSIAGTNTVPLIRLVRQAQLKDFQEMEHYYVVQPATRKSNLV